MPSERRPHNHQLYAKEAQSNATLARQSAGVSNALNPVKGVRDAMRRAGIKPKNHHADNLRRMREKQRQVQEKKLEEEPHLLKKRFPKVKSKCMEAAKIAATAPGDRQKSFMRRAAKPAPSPPLDAVSVATSRRTLTKPAVPRLSKKKEQQTVLETKDFLSMNRQNAKGTAPFRAAAEAEKDYTRKKNFGKIPDYLIKRRLEAEERKEAERLLAEQEVIPPGMKLMSEEERVSTLELLQSNADQLVDALSKLSLTSDTLRQRQREQGLREKLEEVEGALKIFRKKKVYITE